MNCNFKIHITELGSKWFYVNIEDKQHYVLGNFTDSDWTPIKVQEIIDGVNQSKSEGKRYEWANEDIHLVALSNGVYFFDLMARRADKNHPTGQDLDLRHDEFISFLHDFKKFVEENQ